MRLERFYVNLATGESTYSRRDALLWHHCGFTVEVYLNGRKVFDL